MQTIDLIMLILFLLLFTASIMKLKPFLATRELKDDDTTAESIATLYGYIYKVLDTSLSKELSYEEMFEEIKSLETFDSKHFWRLTPNRLRNLTNEYYIKHNIESLSLMHQKMQEELKLNSKSPLAEPRFL